MCRVISELLKWLTPYQRYDGATTVHSLLNTKPQVSNIITGSNPAHWTARGYRFCTFNYLYIIFKNFLLRKTSSTAIHATPK